jgi:hypothetical protein
MMLSTRELVDAGLMPAIPEVMGLWFHALDPNIDTAALWEAVPQPVLGIWASWTARYPLAQAWKRFATRSSVAGTATIACTSCRVRTTPSRWSAHVRRSCKRERCHCAPRSTSPLFR